MEVILDGLTSERFFTMGFFNNGHFKLGRHMWILSMKDFKGSGGNAATGKDIGFGVRYGSKGSDNLLRGLHGNFELDYNFEIKFKQLNNIANLLRTIKYNKNCLEKYHHRIQLLVALFAIVLLTEQVFFILLLILDWLFLSRLNILSKPFWFALI